MASSEFDETTVEFRTPPGARRPRAPRNTVPILELLRFLPLRVGVPNLLASLLFIAYALALSLKAGCGMPQFTPAGVVLYLYSLFTLNLLVQVNAVLVGAWQRLYVSVGVLGAELVIVLMGYHHGRRTPLDYQTISLNFGNGLGDGNVAVVVDSIGSSNLIIAALAGLVFAVADRRYGWLRRHGQWKHRSEKLVTCAALLSATLFGPFDTLDPITYLMRTSFEVAQDDAAALHIPPGVFPYVTESASVPTRPQARPPVFLILMESLNARYVAARNTQGKPVMPTFNSLIAKGAYFEWFYANSIQTSKGHAATLLSILPASKGKIVVDYGADCFQSIASVLGERGYSTLFFQAYENLNYEGGADFYSRNGFQRVVSAAQLHTTANASESWGWGLRDDVVYRELFDYLDGTVQERQGRPSFVVVAPISNHMPFDKVPKDQRFMYADASERYEHYANSVHLSDLALKTFFDELERRPEYRDSLVLITGDHSFPTGEHGYTTNVSSYEDEFFRTPLLIIWPNHVPPERVRDIPYSQVDIAPTIVDLLGIGSLKSHFLGHSVFERTARPIFLIQPYSGVYLGVVDPPYKFVRHVRSGREHLFNLAADPNEQQDLAGGGGHEEQTARLRKSLQRIAFNERLLAQNQVWPCRLPPQ